MLATPTPAPRRPRPHVIPHTIHVIPHRRCRRTLEYDGASDGVLNLSNKTLMHWELGYDYADSMLRMALTYAAHYRCTEARYQRMGYAQLLMDRSTHRFVWA